ncbi:MAG: ABC-2 family transporter protein [Treponema sp.]|jgi:ABC-2 type transport system permease protein|nr:ABC-2 family transporter protein [Treponema sp.]
MNCLLKYVLFFKGAFKSSAIYRLSTLVNICRSVIFIFVQYSLWKALIQTGIRQDVNLRDMVVFIMITEAVRSLCNENIANDIGASIRDGSVTISLLQPMSHRLYLFSTMLGYNCYELLTSALPVIVVGSLMMGFPLPASPVDFLFFVLMTAIGIFLLFEINYVSGLMAFWTQSTWFISWYVEAGDRLFGGSVVPLWFYPDALKTIARYLPFRYVSFEGVNFFLGRVPVPEMARSLVTALIWCAVLYVAGKMLWFRAQKKLTVNGG